MVIFRNHLRGILMKNDKEVLLVEYQAAQESAQHHDNLIWTVTAIIWGGMLVLFGFVLGNLANANLQLILTLLSIIGLVLTIAVLVFVLQFNLVMRQKYQRCKTIEKLLGMGQHSELKYSSGLQKIIYNIITVFFVIAWFTVIWLAWKAH